VKFLKAIYKISRSQTVRRTDRQAEGQPENIMYPGESEAWRRYGACSWKGRNFEVLSTARYL